MSHDFWNARYAADEYAYGTAPNEFLREALEALTPGTILFPAEGEGRNAVYAATRGWQVSAFDQSSSGQQKALALAASKGVTITYTIADADLFACEPDSFDCVALIFAHFPPDLRKRVHAQMVRALRPGGTLILEAFSPAQLGRPSGGPKELPMLYTVEALQQDFAALTSLEISEAVIQLSEGPFHQGEGAVIRAVGKRN